MGAAIAILIMLTLAFVIVGGYTAYEYVVNFYKKELGE